MAARSIPSVPTPISVLAVLALAGAVAARCMPDPVGETRLATMEEQDEDDAMPSWMSRARRWVAEEPETVEAAFCRARRSVADEETSHRRVHRQPEGEEEKKEGEEKKTEVSDATAEAPKADPIAMEVADTKKKDDQPPEMKGKGAEPSEEEEEGVYDPDLVPAIEMGKPQMADGQEDLMSAYLPFASEVLGGPRSQPRDIPELDKLGWDGEGDEDMLLDTDLTATMQEEEDSAASAAPEAEDKVKGKKEGPVKKAKGTGVEKKVEAGTGVEKKVEATSEEKEATKTPEKETTKKV